MGAAIQSAHSSRIKASTVRRNLQYGIWVLSSLSAGSGAEPQSPMVFGKFVVKWSSFSSTDYHVRKTNARDFEQVDDVVIEYIFFKF